MDDNEQFRDIRAYINEQLRPRIEQLRTNHQTKSRVFYVSAVISTVVVVALLGVAGTIFDVTRVGTLQFVAAVAVVVVYGLALHGVFHLLFVRGARQHYVETVVAGLIEQIHPGVDYDGEQSISQSDFEQGAIAQLPIADFDGYEQFRGDLQGAQVRFGAVDAICRGRKEGQKFARKQDCFLLRGLFFVAQLQSAPRGTTVVFPTLRRFTNADELPRIVDTGADHKAVVRPAAGWPHVQWSPQLHHEPMGEVTLPDPEFHHRFDVYSTHIGEARALLRPPVVERLKTVHQVWSSDVHRAPIARVEGQGFFMVVVRDGRLFVGRPTVRSVEEISRFELAQQIELLVQFGADVRLGLELVETIATSGVEA